MKKTEQGKIFAIHISDKRLTFRIYREQLLLIEKENLWKNKLFKQTLYQREYVSDQKTCKRCLNSFVFRDT